VLTFWAVLLHQHHVTIVVLAVLYYCVRVTRDYRLRKKLFHATAHLDDAALREQFQRCMWIAGLYAAKPFRPVVSHRQAALALIRATVLRERICLNAKLDPPRSYLRSRRQLIRAAKAYAREHQSLWRGPNPS